MTTEIGRQEKGMALFVSLIFLLLLTVVGVVAMQGASLQEKMAGNTGFKNESFQSAEALLRLGEAYIANENNADALLASCSVCNGNGCRVPDWSAAQVNVGGSICGVWLAPAANSGISGLYQIQNLGTAINPVGMPSGESATLYRVTAVSKVGASVTALESVYARN